VGEDIGVIGIERKRRIGRVCEDEDGACEEEDVGVVNQWGKGKRGQFV